jgi:hypothetical protein
MRTHGAHACANAQVDGEAVREPERGQEVVLFIPLPQDLGQAGDGRSRVHRYRSLDLRFGRELRAVRARYGLTQDEAARVLAASSSAAISRWEAGQKVPEGLHRERPRELLDGRLWPELRAALLGDESFPGPWREAVRWYRRAPREVPARQQWSVRIGRILDSLLRARDLAGLQLAYVEAGPVGSAGAALTGTAVGSVERRVQDAAFGLRWLEIAHARRFDLNRSLARAAAGVAEGCEHRGGCAALGWQGAAIGTVACIGYSDAPHQWQRTATAGDAAVARDGAVTSAEMERARAGSSCVARGCRR